MVTLGQQVTTNHYGKKRTGKVIDIITIGVRGTFVTLQLDTPYVQNFKNNPMTVTKISVRVKAN